MIFSASAFSNNGLAVVAVAVTVHCYITIASVAVVVAVVVAVIVAVIVAF